MNKLLLKTALGLCITLPSFAEKTQQEPGYELEYAYAKTKQHTEKNRGTFASVGSGASCTYRIGTTKIQDAIDAGEIEIRLVEEEFNENVLIDDVDVSLLGGYPTCDDANNNTNRNLSSYVTTINPVDASGNPVIRITGSDTRNTVNIENISISNGEDNGFYTSGGISTLLADMALNLKQVEITSNEGSNGGGLAIVAGNTDVYMEDVYILYNTAEFDGGGMYCSGADASVLINSSYNNSVLAGRAGFFSNNAADSGGGAFITSGCSLTSYVGGHGFGNFRGFRSNVANLNGGGLAVMNGAKANLWGNRYCTFTFPFTCYGNQSEANSFKSNTADNDNDGEGDGGAIYVSGTDSQVNANNQHIEGNRAEHGAGVALADNATMTTNTSYYGSLFFNYSYCWSNEGCNQYIGNLASQGVNQQGGAFYVSGGASLEANQTIMRDNRADYGAGVYVINDNSTVKMEGNLIANNGDALDTDYLDNFPVRAAGGGSFEGHYITVADNNANTASIGNNSSTMILRSSIVHDSNGANGYNVVNAVVSSIHCVISNEAASFNGVNMTEDDPIFVDRANGDFHIDAAFSPAVDYCHSAFADENYNDIDEEPRGWDDYVASDTYGTFDIGYDETYQNDVIFKDGHQ